VDKAGITPAVVERLLAAQFPQWADLPVIRVELDGWDNTTFRLGDEMSVRLPSGDAYTAQVDKEHRWLPYLAPQLPLPIPQPLAKGAPTQEFPRPWSIYRWLEGEPATVERIADLERFATDLAAFLDALYRIDCVDEVAAGPQPPPRRARCRLGRADARRDRGPGRRDRWQRGACDLGARTGDDVRRVSGVGPR